MPNYSGAESDFFSLNVQAVCNADMLFTNLVARWRGSVHYSRIFRMSRLKQQFENRRYQGILFGDNGYGCEPYLMTPFLSPQTDAERRYNKALIKSRITIERTFGVWKRVFPCLSLGLRTNVSTTMAVIVATAVLYNYARKTRRVERCFVTLVLGFHFEIFSRAINLHIHDDLSEPAEEMRPPDNVLNTQSGIAARRQLVQSHFATN